MFIHVCVSMEARVSVSVCVSVCALGHFVLSVVVSRFIGFFDMFVRVCLSLRA